MRIDRHPPRTKRASSASLIEKSGVKGLIGRATIENQFASHQPRVRFNHTSRSLGEALFCFYPKLAVEVDLSVRNTRSIKT